MSGDAQPKALGWLLIVLALTLATTPWWRASIFLLFLGVAIPGWEMLWESLRKGFAVPLGWTDETDEVE